MIDESRDDDASRPDVPAKARKPAASANGKASDVEARRPDVSEKASRPDVPAKTRKPACGMPHIGRRSRT